MNQQPREEFNRIILEARTTSRWLIVCIEFPSSSLYYIIPEELRKKYEQNFVFLLAEPTRGIGLWFMQIHNIKSYPSLYYIIDPASGEILDSSVNNSNKFDPRGLIQFMDKFLEKFGKQPANSIVKLIFDFPYPLTLHASTTQPFHTILDKLALEFKVNVREYSFTYRNRIIKGTDTPSQLKMRGTATIKVQSSPSAYPTPQVKKEVPGQPAFVPVVPIIPKNPNPSAMCYPTPDGAYASTPAYGNYSPNHIIANQTANINKTHPLTDIKPQVNNPVPSQTSQDTPKTIEASTNILPTPVNNQQPEPVKKEPQSSPLKTKDSVKQETKDEKVKIIFVGIDEKEHNCTISRNRKIGIWLQTRCKASNLDMNKLDIRRKGRKINFEKTPAELKIENNERIIAYLKEGVPLEQAYLVDPSISRRLVIKVVGPNNMDITKHLDPSSNFEGFFSSTCYDYNLNENDYNFIYDDKVIRRSDTPSMLGMKSGQVIKIVHKPNNGFCLIF